MLFESHFSLFIDGRYDDSMISKAFNTCFQQAEQMLIQTNIDSSLSGSTVVVVIIIDNKLWCGNVGDSRAVFTFDTIRS